MCQLKYHFHREALSDDLVRSQISNLHFCSLALDLIADNMFVWLFGVSFTSIRSPEAHHETRIQGQAVDFGSDSRRHLQGSSEMR
jgi:hypothetical protein